MPKRRRWIPAAVLLGLACLTPLPGWAGRSPVAAAFDSMSDELEAGYRANRPIRAGESLAVLDFTVEAPTGAIKTGRRLARMMQDRLARKDLFEVISARNTGRLMQQERISSSTGIGESGAVEIGQRIGAALVVWGSVVRAGSVIRVECALADTERGEVVARTSRELDGATVEDELGFDLGYVPPRVWTVYLAATTAQVDSGHTSRQNVGWRWGGGTLPIRFTEEMRGRPRWSVGAGVHRSLSEYVALDVSAMPLGAEVTVERKAEAGRQRWGGRAGSGRDCRMRRTWAARWRRECRHSGCLETVRL